MMTTCPAFVLTLAPSTLDLPRNCTQMGPKVSAERTPLPSQVSGGSGGLQRKEPTGGFA